SSLAQEPQVMADAGVEPVMPPAGTTQPGMTTGRTMAGDLSGGSSMETMSGDTLETFEDQAGNRYIRADDYDRMMATRTGTAQSSGYDAFFDGQGTRYYRLDANNQPMTMMGATAMPPGGAMADPSMTTTPQTEAAVFEDGVGNRYMRVDERGRIVAPTGSAMASMDVSSYPIYQDAEGNRYVRVDENNQPMMTSAVQ
ncbi:MAG TPA: hypothetical protein VFO41_01150, partial [Alphaproteobacteria bacterium]|nr:hypothetical protein [Alphaproteobacteria bacterium]